MKNYIRVFGKKIRRTSLLYDFISLLARFGPLIGPIVQPRKLDVKELDIFIDSLKPGLNNLKILHLSDIHSGPYLTEAYLRKVVAVSNSLNPDLVCITGDFTEIDNSQIELCAEILSEIKSKYGSFGVLGNHDFFNGADDITKILRSNNIEILRNQNKKFEISGHSLYIAGIDDYWIGEYDLESALSGINGNSNVVMLSHNPDSVSKIVENKVDLILCGHTHGGQWKFPFVGCLYIPLKHNKFLLEGLHKVAKSVVYVNRGIGSTFIPIRIGCKPEISLLSLKSSNR